MDRPRRARRLVRETRSARLEVSAGGIIFRRRQNGIEFLFIRHGYGPWTFAKGHQKFGETLVETAVREIREETGLFSLRFLASLGKTIYKMKGEQGETIYKTVHFFLFEVGPDQEAHPSGEEEIWEIVWVPNDQAFKTCGYKNLCRLLSKAQRIIRGETMR